MVMKMIRIIGHSPNSWQEAAEKAVMEASKTVRHIKSVKVEEFGGVIEDGKIKEYYATVTLTFEVER